MRQTSKRHWFLLAAFLPPVLAGLFIALVQVRALVRYDPAYFSHVYTERYDTPSAVSLALETALQTGDRALLAELQGLGRPAAFKTGPHIVLVAFLDRRARYYDYLYADNQTYARYVHHVEMVRGRWVVAPSDAHYYLHSGRWMAAFGPSALLWWLLELTVILALWGYRAAANYRARMHNR